MADLTPVAGEDGLLEIRFSREMAGETEVDLEYLQASQEAGSEVIEPIVLEDVRQISYFTAIQTVGWLEVEAGTLPRGWQKTDWAVV